MLRWIGPFVRYSLSRDAHVLRGVGRHIGPVYKVIDGSMAGDASGASDARHPNQPAR